MRFLKQLKSLVLISALTLTAQTAKAVPVLDYSGAANPGIAMEITAAGVFQTVGAAALDSFLNWASFLPVVDGVGKIRISGVQIVNPSSNAFIRETTGGMVEALDAANNVLLSASFTSGVILSGAQFTVGTSTFGGLLASQFIPTSASHTISLIGWESVAGGGSRGLGNGLLAGTQSAVPEPATMLLLGSGLLGAAVKRKRA